MKYYIEESIPKLYILYVYVCPWYFRIHVLYVVIMHTSHLYVLLSVPYFLCINNDIKFHLFALEFEDHVMNFVIL